MQFANYSQFKNWQKKVLLYEWLYLSTCHKKVEMFSNVANDNPLWNRVGISNKYFIFVFATINLLTCVIKGHTLVT